MRDHHQTFTVFGGSFVAERRDSTPPAQKPKSRSFGPLAILLTATLLGATIPAVAVTTSNHYRAAEAARWKQPQPTYFLHVPAAVGFDQTLY
jgi:hypothetical protein